MASKSKSKTVNPARKASDIHNRPQNPAVFVELFAHTGAGGRYAIVSAAHHTTPIGEKVYGTVVTTVIEHGKGHAVITRPFEWGKCGAAWAVGYGKVYGRTEGKEIRLCEPPEGADQNAQWYECDGFITRSFLEMILTIQGLPIPAGALPDHG